MIARFFAETFHNCFRVSAAAVQTAKRGIFQINDILVDIGLLINRNLHFPVQKSQFILAPFLQHFVDGTFYMAVIHKRLVKFFADAVAACRKIGDLWQAKSGGKGLFLMAEKNKDGLTVAEQIEVKINK